jgi:hypothetical protein
MPYAEHPSAGELPQRTESIWRFMSLAKLLDLLSTSTLYFPQLLVLRRMDPFEGSSTRPNRVFYERLVSDAPFAREFLRIPADAVVPDLNGVFAPEFQKSIRDRFAATVYVSCWHLCRTESAALWSAYAGQPDGVAVRSTIGALVQALAGEPRPIYVGRVRPSCRLD